MAGDSSVPDKVAGDSSVPRGSKPCLEGRRVLVAGASSGIGRACALECARRGARVLAVSRRKTLLQELEELYAERIYAFEADLSKEDQRRVIANRALEHLGGLDALVYTAGWAPLSDVAHSRADTWRNLLEVNLVGAARLFALCRKMLAASGHGTLVVTSSHSVPRPWPGLVPYAASKAALEALAEGLSREEPWLRVICHVVHPTATGFADSWDQERATQAMQRWDADGLLEGRLWQAEEVAEEIMDRMTRAAERDPSSPQRADHEEPSTATRASSQSGEGPS